MHARRLTAVAPCILTMLFVSIDGTGSAAQSTIYSLKMDGKMKLTAKQRPKVRRIMRRSTKDLFRVLRKYGINPYSRSPSLVRISRAANELTVIGHRERRALSKVLTHKQMRIYGQLTEAVRRRVTRAVLHRPAQKSKGPPRSHRIRKKKKRRN